MLCKGMNPWRRVLKYVIPVMAFSTLFSIPKFFETRVMVTYKLFQPNSTTNYSFI